MRFRLSLLCAALGFAGALSGPAAAAAAALPADSSQIVELMFKANRGDDAAALRVAQLQLGLGDPVGALNRIVSNVRRGDIASREQLQQWLESGVLKLKPQQLGPFLAEYTAGDAHGDAFGPLMLGLFAQYGFAGTPMDVPGAIKLYKRAASAGSIWALSLLGRLYETGHAPELAPDLALAAFWYGQAQGHDPEATARIVAMYRKPQQWPGREPRTEDDLKQLEASQRAFSATAAASHLGP